MLIRFEPQDSLFFREARPMEAQGVKPLGGRFPPPARTVAGAVRSLLGEALKVDWERYRNDRDRSGHEEIDAMIGPPRVEPPGPLRLTGPYPTQDGKRLYPAPLHLLRAKRKDGDEYDYAWLAPGEPVNCDLGKVRLPALDRKLEGAEPLENGWLSRADFLRVLRGEEPLDEPLFTEDQENGKKGMIAAEPRLGIALEHPRRGIVEGQLYQTIHARMRDGMGIGVEVAHQDGRALPNLAGKTVRFGGEGRFIHVDTSPLQPPLSGELLASSPDKGKIGEECKPPKGVILVLLTPANFHVEGSDSPWLPPDFTAVTRDGTTIWQGVIADVELFLVAAAIGKAVREGGWNLQAHAPRPAETLLPAGSVFFCETADPLGAVDKLNAAGLKLGADTVLGRGEIAVGYWFA